MTNHLLIDWDNSESKLIYGPDTLLESLQYALLYVWTINSKDAENGALLFKSSSLHPIVVRAITFFPPPLTPCPSGSFIHVSVIPCLHVFSFFAGWTDCLSTTWILLSIVTVTHCPLWLAQISLGGETVYPHLFKNNSFIIKLIFMAFQTSIVNMDESTQKLLMSNHRCRFTVMREN